MSKINFNTAVIIGSSVGGLVAARVLSPIFKKVILLEKNNISTSPELRQGTPQSAHLHNLLLKGLNILEELYPGISQTLVEQGATELKAGLDHKIFEFDQWMPERDLGFTLLAQSRVLLESILRENTLPLKNVELLQDTRVLEILLSTENTIEGVLATRKDGQEITINSDIVVDASGAAGVFVKKLVAAHPEMSKEEVISSNVAYSTAFLKKPDEWLNTKESVQLIPSPPNLAGGALLDIENDTWCVSLHGRNGVIPPNDFTQWKEFAKNNLPDRSIWDRIKNAELINSINVFRKPSSIWRRFDLIKEPLSGYFPIGDTISTINPIFGQGMTVAFGHASALKEAFSAGEVDIQKLYLQKACDWSAKAWRKVYAYESTFPSENSSIDHSKSEILLKLAQARHSNINQDPASHKAAILQSQMMY